ncbi:MAG TPA: VWA domain-containing protein [Terracidiphilus sp.]|nr:VWA domain-containing protein [Terracidiphilus sp.]
MPHSLLQLFKRARGFPLLAALCLFAAAAFAQQPQPPNPRLLHRPPPKPSRQSAVTPEGRIHLDVVIADPAGKPVLGLQPWDFTLLDNGKHAKILSFRAFNSATVKPEPPVQVFLLLDTVNQDFSEVAFVRHQLEDFLRSNGGLLPLPVSLIVFGAKGVRIQARPTQDGNALAKMVHRLHGTVRTLDPAMGSQGALERFQLSVRQLESIAENSARQPGRKLLVWLGYGWPILNRPDQGFSQAEQRRYFDAIVELTNRLREARMVLYSVNPTYDSAVYSQTYRAFLNPVLTARQADTGNLALKVLVTQTGGKILGPSNDLAGQVRQCMVDADKFYTLSFNPPAAESTNVYHSLQVQVDHPGLTVRTSAGYYNEPK